MSFHWYFNLSIYDCFFYFNQSTCPGVGAQWSLHSVHHPLISKSYHSDTTHYKLDTNQFAMSNLILTHSPPCFVGFGATPHSQLSSNLSFFRGWPLLLSFFFFFFFLLFFFFFLLPRAKLWLFPIRSIARRSWLTLTLDKTNSFSSDDLCLEICTKIWQLHKKT